MPAHLAKIPDAVFDEKRLALSPRARVTPILSPEQYFTVVRSLIEKAQTSVDVQQQYILAGGPRTEALLSLLEQRRNELTLRFMVSPAFRKTGARDNWELSVASLDAAGLNGRLRALNLDFFTHLHNKGVIVDRRVVVVSSTNWSENSITRAREAGVVVESPDVAEYFARVFDADWDGGIDPADLPRNLLDNVNAALFRPDGFEEVHPADLS
jgi:phosphatidylserine/phosphatidylglycerophosphate/cardiolipin synthase-like enzyme